MLRRSKALQTVMNHCLETVDRLPHAQRVDLYIGLAELCGDPKEAASYHKLADEEVRLECQRRRLQCQLRFGPEAVQ